MESKGLTGGRKKGSINLPKFVLVPLKALMIGRTPDAMIPVDKDFAKGVMLVYNAPHGGDDEGVNQIEENEPDVGIAGMEIKYFPKNPE